MRLRAAAPGDVAALAAIAAEAYRTTFAGILDAAAIAQRGDAFFAGHFARKLAQVRVAEAAGRVVGFAQVTGTHLDMLFVAAHARGTGAGSALLAEAEAAGVRSLECFRDNAEARRFYERRGWRLAAAYEREFIGRSRAFVRYETGAAATASA